MMVEPERYAIAALEPESINEFPSFSLRRIWDDYLLAAREHLYVNHGVSLHGVRIEHRQNAYPHRNFDEIVTALGLGPPLNSKVRFLFSDRPVESLPERNSPNDLLVMVEFSDGPITYSPHPLDPTCLRLSCPIRYSARAVADILLDIALANSPPVSQTISLLPCVGRGMAQFYKNKATFLRTRPNHSGDFIRPNAPYGSVSALARANGDFGTQRHLQEFVSIWDQILLNELRPTTDRCAAALAISLRHPGFKKQLAQTSVKNAVESLPPGVHFLFVQRMSSASRMKPAYKNEIDAAFSCVNVMGSGSRRFGIFHGAVLPEPARSLVRKGAAFAVRLYIGESDG
jgi:hypothetical protein